MVEGEGGEGGAGDYFVSAMAASAAEFLCGIVPLYDKAMQSLCQK